MAAPAQCDLDDLLGSITGILDDKEIKDKPKSIIRHLKDSNCFKGPVKKILACEFLGTDDERKSCKEKLAKKEEERRKERERKKEEKPSVIICPGGNTSLAKMQPFRKVCNKNDFVKWSKFKKVCSKLGVDKMRTALEGLDVKVGTERNFLKLCKMLASQYEKTECPKSKPKK